MRKIAGTFLAAALFTAPALLADNFIYDRLANPSHTTYGSPSNPMFLDVDGTPSKPMNMQMGASSPMMSGGYWIQVGAYKHKPYAEKKMSEATAASFSAKIFSKGGMHRVAVGPYDSMAAAKAAKNGVMSLEAKAFVVSASKL